MTVADRDGNVVSLINSLFVAFGSGLVAGRTGIALQNRGRGFVLDPAHPNCIAPGKRPFHTLIPGAAVRRRRAARRRSASWAATCRRRDICRWCRTCVDHGCNIQEALDQPRFHYLGGREVALEDDFPDDVKRRLARSGTSVEESADGAAARRLRRRAGHHDRPATGAYWGGSDRRKDGCAIGY